MHYWLLHATRRSAVFVRNCFQNRPGADINDATRRRRRTMKNVVVRGVIFNGSGGPPTRFYRFIYGTNATTDQRILYFDRVPEIGGEIYFSFYIIASRIGNTISFSTGDRIFSQINTNESPCDVKVKRRVKIKTDDVREFLYSRNEVRKQIISIYF